MRMLQPRPGDLSMGPDPADSGDPRLFHGQWYMPWKRPGAVQVQHRHQRLFARTLYRRSATSTSLAWLRMLALASPSSALYLATASRARMGASLQGGCMWEFVLPSQQSVLRPASSRPVLFHPPQHHAHWAMFASCNCQGWMAHATGHSCKVRVASAQLLIL